MKGRARVSDSTQEEGKEEKGCSTAASAASLGFLYIGSRIRLSFSRCSRSLPTPWPPGRRMTVRFPRRFDHSGKGGGGRGTSCYSLTWIDPDRLVRVSRAPRVSSGTPDMQRAVCERCGRLTCFGNNIPLNHLISNTG